MYGNCNTFYIPPPIPYSAGTVAIEENVYDNVFNPSVWGDGTWLFLHHGSLAASKIIDSAAAEKYWNFIEGLPLMLPCKDCSRHASNYIDSARQRRREICASRDGLLQFFVDFHNSVNLRTGKPSITVDQVKSMLDNRAKVCRVKYF